MSERPEPPPSRPPFAESGRYDPNSPNAMWAMILIKMEFAEKTAIHEGVAIRKLIEDSNRLLNARLDQQDLTSGRIEKQVNETNGRVLSLESWRREIKIKTSTLVMLLGLVGGFLGWLVNLGLEHFQHFLK